MERDVLDAVDQLRNQLGLFYWIIQHGGDVKVAAQLLQDVISIYTRLNRIGLGGMSLNSLS